MNFLTALSKKFFNTPVQIGDNKLATINDVNQVIASLRSQDRNYFRAVTDYFEVTNTTGDFVVSTSANTSCADCTDTEKSKYTCNCGGTIINSGKKESAASITVIKAETGIFDVVVIPDPLSNYAVKRTMLIVGNPSAVDDIISVVKVSDTAFRVKVKDVKTGNLVDLSLYKVPFNLTTFYNV
jgi:hypothetical protein